MLTLFAAEWCPHCQRAASWLKAQNIAFTYVDIEKQPEDVVKKVIEVNGGLDWVVPTLEFKGQWVPGKFFEALQFENDLRKIGALP